jgi:hypothetical protein
LGVGGWGAEKRVVEDGSKGCRIGGGPDPTYRATVGGLGDDDVIGTVVGGEAAGFAARTRCSAGTRGRKARGARLARRVCSGADLVVRSASWAVVAPSAVYVALVRRVGGVSFVLAVAILAGRARGGTGKRAAAVVDVRPTIGVMIVLSREVDQSGRGPTTDKHTAALGWWVEEW